MNLRMVALFCFSTLGGGALVSCTGAGGQAGGPEGGPSADDGGGEADGAPEAAATLDAGPREASAAEGSAGQRDAPEEAAASGDAGEDAADSGVETVATIPAGVARPTGIVVDDQSLFFSNLLESYIYTVPKTGGQATLLANEGPEDEIVYLAGDSTRLYVVDLGLNSYRLDEVPKSGGTFRLLYQSGTASNIDVENVLPDNGVLFLGAGRNAGGERDVVAIDEPSATYTTLYQNTGLWLTANATTLFWVSDGRIYSAAKSGTGTPQQIAYPGSGVSDRIAADGSDVFYLYGDEIHRVTGTVDTLLNPGTTPLGLQVGPMVDATHVYVIGYDNSDVGSIYRVPRGGGAVETMAANQASARGLAQDASYVYWSVIGGASGANASILRKAK